MEKKRFNTNIREDKLLALKKIALQKGIGANDMIENLVDMYLDLQEKSNYVNKINFSKVIFTKPIFTKISISHNILKINLFTKKVAATLTVTATYIYIILLCFCHPVLSHNSHNQINASVNSISRAVNCEVVIICFTPLLACIERVSFKMCLILF